MNPHIGHLGIFISAKVARLEHRAILESLTEIEAIAPGLYEMKIDNPSGDPDCHKSAFSVRFEEQQVKDLKFQIPYAAFERVRQVSEVNERLYATFVGPFIRYFANPWSAEMLEWLHPMRTSRYLLSERFSHYMHGVTELARMIEKHRTPLPKDDPSITCERTVAEQIARPSDRHASAATL